MDDIWDRVARPTAEKIIDAFLAKDRLAAIAAIRDFEKLATERNWEESVRVNMWINVEQLLSKQGFDDSFRYSDTSNDLYIEIKGEITKQIEK